VQWSVYTWYACLTLQEAAMRLFLTPTRLERTFQTQSELQSEYSCLVGRWCRGFEGVLFRMYYSSRRPY